MSFQIAPNPRANGSGFAISQNTRARGSSIVSVDWSAITNKPDLNDFSDILSPALGGTGVDNTSSLTITGSYGITFTLTAITSLTLPTTGTLATLAGVETLSNKTLVAPALGTPASGVATHLTGTAAGLTAGTATNAVNSGISNDTTTNATMFPVWVTANSGNLPLNVASGRLGLNPSIPCLAIGANPDTSALLKVFGGGSTLTGTNQFAMNFQPTFSSGATSNGFGLYLNASTVAASFTMSAYRAVYIDGGTKGSGSTITTQYQIYIVEPTLGGTNYAFYSAGGRNHFGRGISVGTDVDAGTGNIQASGSVKSTGATSGIGYGTGAGGTVTQSTNKSTAVSLNTVTGLITMNNATLNAATIVSFTLNNSAIVATDLIVAAHESGGTTGAYTINARATGSGTAAIDVRNNTAGNLSEAIVIRFAVIKSVSS